MKLLDITSIKNGQLLVFSQHTTIALAINENEERLLENVKRHLTLLAPPSAKYLHNDLHLRDVPPDEPINAHSHLMALMLSTSEVIQLWIENWLWVLGNLSYFSSWMGLKKNCVYSIHW